MIAAYTDAKRVFVTRLRQPRYWYLLNRGGSFGDYAKQNGLYPADLNFHLVEQAAFDVVDTCVRHIQSRLAIGNVKAKIGRRFTDEKERHYAYACLARYSAIGQIMCGGLPKIPTVSLDSGARP